MLCKKEQIGESKYSVGAVVIASWDPTHAQYVIASIKAGKFVLCEVVGETGTVRLPDPSNVVMRSQGARSYEIFPDWSDRFIEAYDIELIALNCSGNPLAYEKDMDVTQKTFKLAEMLGIKKIIMMSGLPVGCGHDLQWWKEIFSVCRMVGYNDYVSLEMEDMTMASLEGVKTSIDALRQTISK